jgi:methylated-DNA-[protein]-cysteine S-methyltransferase
MKLESMTSQPAFALFDTALGPCAVLWSERGITGVQLPERDALALRAVLRKRYPAAVETEPPEHVRRAIAGMTALLAGDAHDFDGVALDLEGLPEFNRKVYALARTIPPGATLTYGEVAARLGDKALARAVGQALGENPIPLIIPCHRVLAAGGKTGGFKAGGFSAPGGSATKLRLLSIEGAAPGGPTLFDRLPLQGPPPHGAARR